MRESEVQKVSVVVVTCSDEAVTTECLMSIVNSRSAPLELVVVNNGAGPRMQQRLEMYAECAASRGVPMRLIAQAERVGACTARNMAMPVVSGRFVAFLDNDVLCTDALWIRKLVSLLESDVGIGAVGPRIMCLATGRVQCAGYAISPRGDVRALGEGACAYDPVWQVRRRVQAVGNFMARTSHVIKAGGFDPDFDPFGFENIDCCYRIKGMGLCVVCDGLTDIMHIGHITTGQFEQEGRNILFEKSVLLRKRHRRTFEQEAVVFKRRTTDPEQPMIRGTH